jgi:tetratricopeptide (TPR) repeat protein
MLFMSGKTSEAAQFYQKLLEVDSNNLMAINNLAWILCEEQGKHKEALEIAQKGLKTAQDYIDLLDTRGIAYFRLGKYDEAIKDFNKCAKLYPGHVPSAVASYFHLGRALAAQGSKDEAVKYLKLALDSNPKIGGLSASDVTEAQNLLGGLIKEPKL